MITNILKSVIDKVISLLLITMLSPIFFLLIIFVAYFMWTNPFFCQYRVGENERIFSLIKFKTMNDNRDSEGNLLSDSERLTFFGKFMRNTSLDELPQLINVIRGDMSLIGPRPLLVQYLPLYTEKQKRRHEIKPGITGWAQVNGRNAISWEKKFEYDVWYVDNLSLTLDIKILYLTILKVLKSEGITQEGNVTMEAFRGH